MKQRFLFASWGLAALTALPGCDSPDQPVPAHTKAWVQGHDGDVLRFYQPATGASDSVRVALTDENARHSNGKLSLGSYHAQVITLKYLMGQPFPNRVITVYPGLEVYFYSSGSVSFRLPAANYGMAEVTTAPDPAAEQATGSYYLAAELLRNTSLNGRSYQRVIHLHLLQPPDPQQPEDFWYSQEDGLVAYALPGSPAWYRR